MNTFYKNLSMWLVIGLTMILLFNIFNKPQGQSSQMTYSEFWSSVETGVINRVTIQGEKIMVTNGPDACVAAVLAVTDREAGQGGFSLFLVPVDAGGVLVGEPVDKMGLRGSSLGSLGFQDSRWFAGRSAAAFIGKYIGGDLVGLLAGWMRLRAGL